MKLSPVDCKSITPTAQLAKPLRVNCTSSRVGSIIQRIIIIFLCDCRVTALKASRPLYCMWMVEKV